MKTIRTMGRATAILALVGLLSVAIFTVRNRIALAQTGGPYGLSWSTIDGGGHTFSTGGNYALSGTIGQPDAGLHTGGDYALGGGFWGGGAQAVRESIYLPVVLRSYGP